ILIGLVFSVRWNIFKKTPYVIEYPPRWSSASSKVSFSEIEEKTSIIIINRNRRRGQLLGDHIRCLFISADPFSGSDVKPYPKRHEWKEGVVIGEDSKENIGNGIDSGQEALARGFWLAK
ncbi:hypothetical protein JTE90_009996, partial [Oedothorax gibbosus]